MSGMELIGKTAGDFVIQARIARGGVATIYRAYQQTMKHDVALKIIRLDTSELEGENFQKRFEREATLIAKLEHIHILPAYVYDVEVDIAYVAMRWFRGGILSHFMKTNTLTTTQITRIFIKLQQH